jgi:hypothetical protein
MELQRSQISQNNLRKEEQNSSTQFQSLSQSKSNDGSVVLA